jgi:hypothetical protein
MGARGRPPSVWDSCLKMLFIMASGTKAIRSSHLNLGELQTILELTLTLTFPLVTHFSSIVASLVVETASIARNDYLFIYLK